MHSIFFYKYKQQSLQIEGVLLYLQANADLLGESSLRERGLDHGHSAAGQHASIRTHVVRLLLDPRHHSKVLREVAGHDAANALLLQLGGAVQLCSRRGRLE